MKFPSLSVVWRTWTLCLIGAVLMAYSGVASADGTLDFARALMDVAQTPPPERAPLTHSIATTVNKAVMAVTNIFSLGARDLKPSGLGLLASLSVLSIAWVGLKHAGGSLELTAAMAEVVKVAAVTGAAYVAIQPVDAFKPFIGDRTLGQFIGAGFNWIASSGGGNPIGENVEAFKSAIVQLWSLPVIPQSLDFWSKLGFVLSQFDVLLVVILMKVLTSIILVLACVITLGHLLVAQIQINLTLYLTPILVPWILFKPLSFLFNSWLKSLISGGMLLMIGKLFSLGALAFITGLGSALPTGGNSTEFYYMAEDVYLVYLGVLFATAMFILVAFKLDNLVNALMHGSVASGINMRDMALAFKAATGSLGKAASVAKGAAGATMGAAAGMSAVKAAGGARSAAAAAVKQPNAFGGLGVPSKPSAAPPMSASQKMAAYMDGRKAYAAARKQGAGLGASYGAARAAGDARGSASISKPGTAPTPPAVGKR